MDPYDFHVQYRRDSLRDEAARQRLARRARRAAAQPGAASGGQRVGRVLRPVRAVAVAVGFVLVRIGVALGASPLDNI